jgi:hypothetical protein
MAVAERACASRARSDWRARPGVAARSDARPQKALQPPPYVLDAANRWMIVRNFVSPAEREALFAKAMRHYGRGELHPNPCGPARFFAKTDDAPAVYVDALLERLTRRCEHCLRLTQTPHDCVLGRTISLIGPGGFIHRHTDAYRAGEPGHRPGLEHCRCNIVVRLAHPSGRPVIEGEALDIAEGDLWVFVASKSFHQTEPLQGHDPRIVFGFGWSVPPSHRFLTPPSGWDTA